jgi:hypothetical protein
MKKLENTSKDTSKPRLYLDELAERVSPLTGAIDGCDLDAPLPLTIVLIVVAA